MIAEALLSRLDGVKRTGVDRWLAKCPAHDDKRPSLGVREIDNDRVLVHCWTGCSTHDVLAVVGLEFDALYPSKPSHRGNAERRPWPAADILRAVANEVRIVAVAAITLGQGGELTEADRARLLLASSRIIAAAQESGHEH